MLKKLKTNRRMGLSEIQLTIEIEQPEEIERNKVLGIEVRAFPKRNSCGSSCHRLSLCASAKSWPLLVRPLPPLVTAVVSIRGTCLFHHSQAKFLIPSMPVAYAHNTQQSDAVIQQQIETPAFCLVSSSVGELYASVVTQNVPSRAERALALTRVTEGKIPENRLALKLLCDELEAWPYLNEGETHDSSRRHVKEAYRNSWMQQHLDASVLLPCRGAEYLLVAANHWPHQC